MPGGRKFRELPAPFQRRINNAQIIVHVIDPTTPGDVKYDIFKRINTGGTPLNAQEIRHCMSGKRSREFLKRCTHTPEFDQATGGRFRDHVRMDDREVVLRYCAFWLLGVDGYRESGSMDGFLESATELLDDPRKVHDERLEALHDSFRQAMDHCYEVFGMHAFRKWPHGAKGRNPINRPLFEAWSHVLATHDRDNLVQRKAAIIKAARDLMTNSQVYIDSVTTSTGDPKKVRLRFAETERAAQAGR